MQYIFIIPFLISLYYVVQGKTEKAFLNVFLPCLFVTPHYFTFRIPHLPAWSACEAALIPIGFGVLFHPVSRWKFRRMDLFVILFILSAAISELTREQDPKDGLFLWLNEFVQMFLAYIVGRQLIEPRLRLESVKRIVFLLFWLTPFVFFEFLAGNNPWIRVTNRLLGEGAAGWFTQTRGGHARVAACFGQAILAGMVFLVGIALNYYLVQIYKRNKTRLGPRMSQLQRWRLPFLLFPIFLVLTSSRGPMLSAVLCFLVMQIPQFKKLRTGVAVASIVLLIGGLSVYSYYQRYTNVSDEQNVSEEQSSAMYRRDLAKNYAPILVQGGWLGYGAMSHPTTGGQDSIDDYFMLVQLSQGKLGLYAFILIACESVFSLAVYAARFKDRETLYLIFCLMGALAGLFITLKSVYLGENLPILLFLLLGWSQSLQDARTLGARVQELPEPKFRFRRVIA